MTFRRFVQFSIGMLCLVTAGVCQLSYGPSSSAEPSSNPPSSTKTFASTRPAQRVDYWQKRLAEITATLNDTPDLSPSKLVFIGDSITDFWMLDENPWVKGQYCGRKIWDESFGKNSPQNYALNLGISGDRLEHVLFRLQPKAAGGLGELDRPDLNPEFLVIMLGINNTWESEDPVNASLFAGIQAVVAAAHERKPKARIVLQSLLPTQDPDKNRKVVIPVNTELSALATRPEFSDFVSYLDLYKSFVDGAGLQIATDFNDGLHPSAAGYRVWRDHLVPFLNAARAARTTSAVAH